jgi:UDP-3-O-[3-hydroxymyristoyl] glucosamine N-acyltransferase
MKFPEPIPVIDIARRFGARLIGDKTIVVTGINEIHKVESGDITFSDVAKYFQKSLESLATVIILNEATDCPDGKAILVCERPFDVYESLVSDHRPFRPLSAIIDPSAKIDPTAVIEPNVVIGPEVTIGAHTHIQANVVIRAHCVIGDRVIIQSGVTIGTDAFYFKKTGRENVKWTSGGRVIIANDVYIGSNSTINKGVSGDTIIGEGTKIDCLVQIGHGVVIGKHCIVAAQAGISGKSTIGDHCSILGQAGIAPGLRIGDNVVVHPKTGIGTDIDSGKSYFGYLGQDKTKAWREIIALRRLPDLIRKMESQITE